MCITTKQTTKPLLWADLKTILKFFQKLPCHPSASIISKIKFLHQIFLQAIPTMQGGGNFMPGFPNHFQLKMWWVSSGFSSLYQNQGLGAANPKGWSKYEFLMFLMAKMQKNRKK